jgi:hypothetical protein
VTIGAKRIAIGGYLFLALPSVACAKEAVDPIIFFAYLYPTLDN